MRLLGVRGFLPAATSSSPASKTNIRKSRESRKKLLSSSCMVASPMRISRRRTQLSERWQSPWVQATGNSVPVHRHTKADSSSERAAVNLLAPESLQCPQPASPFARICAGAAMLHLTVWCIYLASGPSHRFLRLPSNADWV
jgi:hypothetical protein